MHKKRTEKKILCQIQVKIDSSQSDVNSYATNVTAPAGAALTVDGMMPL